MCANVGNLARVEGKDLSHLSFVQNSVAAGFGIHESDGAILAHYDIDEVDHPECAVAYASKAPEEAQYGFDTYEVASERMVARLVKDHSRP
jgi:hypothetical protein